jgi:phenylpropionate dioxygenase-like ring-hydroxylating dioxygenase large terminal subunit
VRKTIATPPYEALVEERPADFRVHTSTYTDPEIFDAEIRYIFEQTWVYVGHESEVRFPGDYRTASIGRQPVIVSRDEHGELHVLLNACRHRGSVVCREPAGNSRAFRCPYHGWVYSNTGRLIGISHRDGYPDGFASDIEGLVPTARVAVYRGLIFASLNGEVGSLERHLGPVREYVDLWADMSLGGEPRLLRPHKYSYPGNWKLQAENGNDGYHPRVVHESAYAVFDQFGVRPADVIKSIQNEGCTRGFERGHGVLEGGNIERTRLPGFQAQLAERYGPERAEAITRRRYVFIFPNLLLMDANVRVIQPRAVDYTEVYSHFTELEGVADATNQERLLDLQRRLGTTGFLQPDDIEIFTANQTGFQASAMEWVTLARGIHREQTLAGGERVGEYMDETPQRALYREWARLMSRAPA